MVGPSGSGKSSAWQVLLEALEAFEGVQGQSYVLDPKVSSYSDLFIYYFCQFLFFCFIIYFKPSISSLYRLLLKISCLDHWTLLPESGPMGSSLTSCARSLTTCVERVPSATGSSSMVT